jgi:putative glutamine amidotransferase
MAVVPLVGVSACVKPTSRYVFHGVGEQYLRAVRDGAGAQPLIVPALGEASAIDALIERLDGLMLTGSPSNVEPARYAGPAPRPDTLLDPARDATTLPLIRAAIDADLPLLALCRGHQELNVALGGTLHQHVHELAGRGDHRAPSDEPNEIRYAPAHDVHFVPGGWLHGWAEAPRARVNSLHSQAIDHLAPRLVVEATARDGTIEAVRVAGARFALGVQWHPEWSLDMRLSSSMFAAWGAALRERAGRRRGRDG